jgi:hypothetical protein
LRKADWRTFFPILRHSAHLHRSRRTNFKKEGEW